MNKHVAPGTSRVRTYRKVPTRLRWKKFLAITSPEELGLNSYRAYWLWMTGIALLTVALFVAALPILWQQQGFFAPWYTFFLAAILGVAAMLAIFGLIHSVQPWIPLLLAAVVGLGVLALPLAWNGGVLLQYPWIGGFIIVSLCSITLAWSPWVALLYMLGVELAYGLIMAQLIPVDSRAESLGAVMFGRICYGLISILTVVMTTRAVEKLDQDYTEALSQELALTRSRSETADQERVDRLIHDNVMAALLDASRAEGPLARRTRELATRALEVLDHENDRLSGKTTTMVHVLMDEIMESLSPWRARVRFSNLLPHIRPVGEPRVFVPTFVAQGLTQAITEAVSNSARHSGADVTYVSMDGGQSPPTPTNPEGFYLRFTVRDEGRGFALHEVGAQRLGVRVSIVENIETVGGDAQLRSAPGRGTEVILTWPKDALP
ncbi:sensor histidine kinase [Kocuria sp.]|uniref:sensor histidine kinase n=1 Tax=Kocuria sp. TaxID=1871328 RepID=UPI0026DEC0B8|nr:ATP-binding protein [Kocuria sp.]MDO5366625.1 ATP-binding protein [Kocuria sp.]